MRKTIVAAFCGALCLAFAMQIQAQDKKTQRFIIHEDHVLPGEVMKYEKANKEFVKALQEHAGAEAAYMAMSVDDMRYIYISPIDNYAALDGNPWAKLEEGVGKDGMKKLFASMNGTYDTHRDYVVSLSHELSYNSGEIMVEGVNFRQLDYYYIIPGKMEEAKALAKEWQELFASKNIPHGYRVYTGGLGTEDMIMVVQWAKNAAEYHANQQQIMEALGEDAKDLNQRTMAVTRKLESFTGWMRPELSFMPATEMAAEN